MKITIYGLLGLVKDGKAPEKIKYDNMIWEYDGDYYSSKNNVILEEYCNLTTSLNEKVEILEEKKKIPEKLNYQYRNLYGRLSQHKQSEIDIIDTLNEIIDYLKSKGE